MTDSHRHGFRRVLLALAVLAAIGGVTTYVKFFREPPAPFFASDEDHFLYGSVGTESQQGIPYWIWLVLPRLFPEYLPGPGGYASIGVLSKDGREMPIGFSKVTVGFPRVGINCAMCHTGSYRLQPGDVQTIVPAAPSHQTAPQLYLRFLFACASDPRFAPGPILDEIAKNTRLSLLDSLLYRYVIIPSTRKAVLKLRDANNWMQQRPDWGRGRIDPFNPVKYRVLGQPVDETIGNADMVPLWNLRRHAGHAYHWDGLNNSLQEVVLSSAIGDGAPPKWVDRDYRKWSNTRPEEMSSLRRIQNYISAVQPPPYPFPVDRQLATMGGLIYKAACASCHAIGGGRTGTVISQADLGTDRHRLDMWTRPAAAAYNAYGRGHEWQFATFRTTNGYVAVGLEGLWLRGPYLHNGSVPSLADLLEEPERRPTMFWRGYDVIDPSKVGFVSTGPEAERAGTPYDTSVPGNSNAGHLYGTQLNDQAKRALLEYLKTL